MNHIARLSNIKEAPLTWKEKDLITAAERYLVGMIDLSLSKFALPCFPKIDKNIVLKIEQVWRCTVASLHLLNGVQNTNDTCKTMQSRAARLYEQEAQRILGSIFSLENKFWTAFYNRQESEWTKPLIAIDALHFYTNEQEQITYQLLLQSVKSILNGYYGTNLLKKEQFENAKRLLTDQPVKSLVSWLNHELENKK